jgi:hypothetical protein
MMMATTPTSAQGGHTIQLKLSEVVPHDGFYRVALSINSRSELPPDNTVYDATGKVLPSSGIGPDGKTLVGTSAKADFESTAVFPVLADNLFPHTGTPPPTYMADIMLPNVNCDHCTLQVIEFMHPHTYNGTPGQNNGGGYFYHHCADLKITADTTMPLFVAPNADGGTTDAKPTTDGGAGSPGTGGTGGSTTTGTGGSTGAAGSAGTAGVAGTGAAGSTNTAGTTGGTAGTGIGTAGTSGAAGNNAGHAGSGSTGVAGAGAPHQSTGGGCAYAATEGHATAPLLVLLLSLVLARKRRG